jgi:hypothetical protein
MIFIGQIYALSQYHLPVRIEADKNEEHDAKGQQRSASITDKGEGDADHRRQSDRHTHVDHDMEEENTGDAVCITSAKNASLSFRYRHDPHKQEHIDAEEYHAPDKPKSLPDGTKDKVRALFGHKVKAGLRALQQAFADQAAAPDRDLALLDVIVIIVVILFAAALLLILECDFGGPVLWYVVLPDRGIDTLDLVRLENMVEYKGDAKPLDTDANEPYPRNQDKDRFAAFDLFSQDI